MSQEQAKEPTSGSSSFGKYQLFASLGRGGMADVFLAIARGPMGFNKLTVIKRLRTDHESDPSFLHMLLDEARLAARLNHPNCVHTYEVGEHGGSYFIAMEYLDGQPLNKVIRTASKQNEVLDAPFCARVIADACSGLHHAHELRDYDGTPLRIIHRDVSPHNIFVTYDGQVKLMDFGIAKAASSSTQTEVGVLKGKVAYMAPEQATGSEVDRRSDIFAMGIVLWELVTQQRLFSGGSAAATLHKLLTAAVPRVSSVMPEVDPKLDAVIAKALEKAPGDRFQTAAEMRNALEEYITSTARNVRQEDIGGRLDRMFGDEREVVHRQIQTHMAAVTAATSTAELASLNLEALKKFEASGVPSGRSLPQLGAESGGSGSGVIAAVDPAPIPGRETSTRKRGLYIGVGALALLALVVLVFKCGSDSAATKGPTGAIASSALSSGPAIEPLPGAAASPSSASAAVVPSSAAPIAALPATPSPSAAESAAAPIGNAVSPAEAHAASHTPNVSGNVGRGHAPVYHPPPPPAPSAAKPAPAAPAPPDEGAPGFLTLDTYPWTRVSEGSRVLGVTPIVHVSLPAGPHVLTLENPEQGLKQTYPVTIKAGESISRRLGLK